MLKILRNRNLIARLEIMVEIAGGGPYLQQIDIARKLDISPQAVSDYIIQLVREGMLSQEGHSNYKVTSKGVDWIIRGLRELSDYVTYVSQSITNISTCTAIADCNLAVQQKVGLKMRNGLLYATNKSKNIARGVTTCSAKEGEDVGVTSIEGIIQLNIGRVTILRVPRIERGGSRKVDLVKLRSETRDKQFIACIGVEAFAAIKQADVKFYFYGAIEAVLEAAKSGLNPLVVCVEGEIPGLEKRLNDERITYTLYDLEKE